MELRSSADHAWDMLPDNDIKAVMLALPEHFRDAACNADVDGRRYRDIAAIMNTPRATVVSRLPRGRGRLRSLHADGDCGVCPAVAVGTG